MRLFIAFPLSSEIKSYLGSVAQLIRERDRSVSWVAQDNLHITLRFLGEADDSDVENLKEMMDEVSKRGEVINCKLSHIDAFPYLRKPRVFWFGVTGDSKIKLMYAMATQIETGVRSLGFAPDDHAFRPHITFGRVRDAGVDPSLLERIAKVALEPREIVIDRIVLFSSDLSPQGPRYTVLHTSPFAS